MVCPLNSTTTPDMSHTPCSLLQVSTSSAVVEQKEVLYSSSQSRLEWSTLEEEDGRTAEEAHEAPRPVMVHFVLEESSGYMEPMLRILAIMHTVISFFCIIGYYCLKVGSTAP